ncbi:Rieske (2Fe-2S) protein [Streptomyces sp. NPDC086787]|uniref:Rieske (2Fe-2S) protein n=1 Tax=Streptomyces sp. NPDC086787 TaxID=3365759 RepID=UPI00380201E3
MTHGSTRRTVLATGGAVFAAACAGCSNSGEGSESASSPGGSTSASPVSSTSKSASPGPSGSAGPELTRTSDVPLGGGLVLPDQKIVITQPTQNEFKAFSAICTHQGCTVNNVADGTIHCPCHGSQFRITDGAVAHGPATRPLPEEHIKIEGDSIHLA